MRNGVARSPEAENLEHFDSQIPQKCIVFSCKNNNVSAKSVKIFRLRRRCKEFCLSCFMIFLLSIWIFLLPIWIFFIQCHLYFSNRDARDLIFTKQGNSWIFTYRDDLQYQNAPEELFCNQARYPGISRIPLVFVTQIKIPSALLHPAFFPLNQMIQKG